MLGEREVAEVRDKAEREVQEAVRVRRGLSRTRARHAL